MDDVLPRVLLCAAAGDRRCSTLVFILFLISSFRTLFFGEAGERASGSWVIRARMGVFGCGVACPLRTMGSGMIRSGVRWGGGGGGAKRSALTYDLQRDEREPGLAAAFSADERAPRPGRGGVVMHCARGGYN